MWDVNAVHAVSFSHQDLPQPLHHRHGFVPRVQRFDRQRDVRSGDGRRFHLVGSGEGEPGLVPGTAGEWTGDGRLSAVSRFALSSADLAHGQVPGPEGGNFLLARIGRENKRQLPGHPPAVRRENPLRGASADAVEVAPAAGAATAGLLHALPGGTRQIGTPLRPRQRRGGAVHQRRGQDDGSADERTQAGGTSPMRQPAGGGRSRHGGEQLRAQGKPAGLSGGHQRLHGHRGPLRTHPAHQQGRPLAPSSTRCQPDVPARDAEAAPVPEAPPAQTASLRQQPAHRRRQRAGGAQMAAGEVSGLAALLLGRPARLRQRRGEHARHVCRARAKVHLRRASGTLRQHRALQPHVRRAADLAGRQQRDARQPQPHAATALPPAAPAAGAERAGRVPPRRSAAAGPPQLFLSWHGASRLALFRHAGSLLFPSEDAETAANRRLNMTSAEGEPASGVRPASVRSLVNFCGVALPAEASSRRNHLPFGRPRSLGPAQRYCVLHQEAFVSGYSLDLKMALWSSFSMDAPRNPEAPLAPVGPECLRADVRIPPSDSRRCDGYSAFRRAFLYPPGLSPAEAERHDALLSSHVVPMYPHFHRIWAYLHGTLLKRYAAAYNGVNVLTGPAFDYDLDGRPDPPQLIRRWASPTNVSVPTHYFAVLSSCRDAGQALGECDGPLRAVAFLLPHRPDNSENCKSAEDEASWVEDHIWFHQARVRDVEWITGLDFYQDSQRPLPELLQLKTRPTAANQKP
ncbi:uncharacterized protein LOC144006995 isoform X6 [Festucalex cinctus]